MPFDDSLLEALTASLARQVGSYFDSISAGGPRPLAQFNTSEKNTVYVVYSASGLPLSVGCLTEGPRKRGRQGPPADVLQIRTNVPGATYASISVKNGELAENLVRLIQQLFGAVLPFNKTGLPQAKTAGAKKRRGRPPGSGRKRGRPAKAASAAVARRGPGRPRINVTAGAQPPVKRGPGRPRKNAASPTGVKRGPGRPPKSAAAGAKRGPGRPPKSAGAAKGVKRGPGRPPKNAGAAPAVKRGPGRPPKSVNAAPTEKRGPGRPRKNPLPDQSAAPKRRGRKKGSKNKPKVA